MRRSRILIVGAAVIVLLVGALVLVKNLPKKAPKPKPSITLSKIAKDKIKEIRLEHNGQSITLKQIDKNWKVEYSQKLDWDQTSIQAIVNSFTYLTAQREIEKKPVDLAQFGLKPPVATAVAILVDGSKVEFDIGNKTPTGTGYYVMKKSDKPLYTVATFTISPLLSTIDSLRNKQLPSINTKKLTYLKLTEKGRTIEIRPIPAGAPLQNVSFSRFEMVQPYKTPHAVDTEKLSAALRTFPAYLTIQSFVTDKPTNLAAYGLSPAKVTLVMKDDKTVLDIELGTKLPNGNMYAKLAGKPSVFEVSYTDFQSVLDETPFHLLDKFLLIPNIDIVDRMEIKTPQQTYTAIINRVKEKGAKPNSSGKIPMKTTYIVNNTTVKESDFKSFYQDVIGLLADSPNPKPDIAFNPEITVTFHLNKGAKRTYREYFVPYNRDFYAVFLNGAAQLLLDRSQVKKMITAAEDVAAGKKPPI